MARLTGQDSPEQLTPREREVLDLLRQRLSDAQIGERLAISRRGASYHVSEIIGKLGVRNRHEAATWPRRPPWWATGIAPVALFWRKAAGGLPGGASAVALAFSIGLFALALAGAGLMAFLLLRSNGGTYPALSEIVVPGSAIEAIESYAFSTKIEVSSSEGDLDLSYDGVSQGLLTSKGTFTGSGDLLQGLGLPAEADLIFLDPQIWLREPGGAWQEPDWGAVDSSALMNFGVLGTPWFYLETYGFERLRLPAEQSVDTINGVRAQRVQLNKSDVIALLLQLTSGNVGETTYRATDEDIAGVREGASENMPEDMVIETWIAEDGRYPVRLVITFTVSDSGEGSMGVFPPLSSVRLEMDIAEPDADAVIEPPSEES